MLRSLIAAAIAAALIVPVSVDVAAARSYKRHVTHHGRTFHRAPVRLYGGYRHRGHGWNGSPPMAGPPWAGPNQCWEDLGYGRYEKCNW